MILTSETRKIVLATGIFLTVGTFVSTIPPKRRRERTSGKSRAIHWRCRQLTRPDAARDKPASGNTSKGWRIYHRRPGGNARDHWEILDLSQLTN